MRAKLKDVAERAGVAPNTASTILNRRPNNWASKATVERVFEAARELGYSPSKAAVGLRLGKFKTLGLLVPDLQNPFFCQLADLIDRSLEARGYDLIIESTRLDPKREQRCIESLFNRQVDGVFLALMDPTNFTSVFSAGAPAHTPAVLLSGVGHNPLDIDTVAIDYAGGLGDAIDHLATLGHRRIIFLSALASDHPADNRTEVFRERMQFHGLPFEDTAVIRCGPTMDSTRKAFAAFLASIDPANRPTAVVALNDLSAVGVIRAAAEFGLSVPEELSVIGVDDTPIGAFLPRALTTVACDSGRLVEAVVNVLFERLNNDASSDRPGAVTTVLPTHLQIRESTAVPPV